ncbi:MAG TPA: hypothetical protein VGP61_08115, partial [Gemmatimonadales bacterium]|nr:hypothetical protein [Gemmatimonadales bacterium]
GQQRPDGSFPPSARLRVPSADALEASQSPERTIRTLDDRASFTTATVLFALTAAYRLGPGGLGGE